MKKIYNELCEAWKELTEVMSLRDCSTKEILTGVAFMAEMIAIVYIAALLG